MSKNQGPDVTVLQEGASEVSAHAAMLAAAGLSSPPQALGRGALTRYLRARGEDPAAAGKMLASSAAWARASPAPGPCERCRENARAHSFYGVGPSDTGEPVMYSNYAAQNTDADDNIAHMRFAMDATFDAPGVPPLARMTWVMDTQFFGRRHVSPTIARRVLTLFADHYPERLGCAVVYDAPLIFSGLFRAVKLFADPATVRKVVFVKHNPATRRRELEAVGISGDTLDRLLAEIDEARDPAVFAAKNWWATPPLAPLAHYGAALLSGAPGDA